MPLRHAGQVPNVKTFTIADVFGEWREVQREHFGDNGVFDQIYKPGQ